MKFTDILKESKNESISETPREIIRENTIIKIEEEKKADQILRGNDIKIKMITPTAFGTQIDLAKLYDEDEIKELLKDFNIKIKGKSIFVVD